MRKRILLAALPLVALIFTSCEKYRCVEGNGRRVTEIRKPGVFYGVASFNDCEVQIYIDTSLAEPEIVIEADENILPYIETSVHSQDLEIGTVNDKCLETDFPIYVDITMPSLDYVELGGSGEILCQGATGNSLTANLPGSGKIRLENIDFEHVKLDLSGSGIIELTGNAYDSKFILSGSGTIIADQLRQYYSNVNLSGSGIMYVWAIEELSGIISGSGIIYYRAPHRLDIDVTGSGYYSPL